MKELQRKSLATAEFDETLGSHVYSVHDLQGFQIDILLWLCPFKFTVGPNGLDIGNAIALKF